MHIKTYSYIGILRKILGLCQYANISFSENYHSYPKYVS